MKRRIHSVKHQAKKVRKTHSRARRFSDAAINQIRHDYEKLKMSLGAIGKKYLTTKDHISKVVKRKIYKNV